MHRAQKSLPVHECGGAIGSAVSWLGNRYLLAVPVNAPRRPRSVQPFFAQPVNWWRRAEGANRGTAGYAELKAARAAQTVAVRPSSAEAVLGDAGRRLGPGAGNGGPIRKDLVARWMTDGREGLRVLGSFATAAYVTRGAVGSSATAILWLLQHRPTRTQS